VHDSDGLSGKGKRGEKTKDRGRNKQNGWKLGRKGNREKEKEINETCT
jgi:hypothetical protein